MYNYTGGIHLKIGQARVGGKVTWSSEGISPIYLVQDTINHLAKKHGAGPFVVTRITVPDRKTYLVHFIDNHGDEVAIDRDYLIESFEGRFVRLTLGEANIGGKVTWTNSKISPSCNTEGLLDRYMAKHGEGPFTVIAIDVPQENIWLIRFVDQHGDEVAIDKDFFIGFK
jgi:hypothetical protein